MLPYFIFYIFHANNNQISCSWINSLVFYQAINRSSINKKKKNFVCSKARNVSPRQYTILYISYIIISSRYVRMVQDGDQVTYKIGNTQMNSIGCFPFTCKRIRLIHSPLSNRTPEKGIADWIYVFLYVLHTVSNEIFFFFRCLTIINFILVLKSVDDFHFTEMYRPKSSSKTGPTETLVFHELVPRPWRTVLFFNEPTKTIGFWRTRHVAGDFSSA